VAPDPVELDRALRSLGSNIAFPDAPDLSTAVGWRIAALEAGQGERRPRRWHRIALATAALVVAGVAVLGFSPRARSAVADLFDVAGIDIRYGAFDDAPPLGENLRLGTRVGLDQAQARADFPIRVPRALGDPVEVYLRNGEIVSLVYDDVLITEFAADVGDEFVVKKVPAGTVTKDVTVREDVPGFWFAGEPHALLYNDDDTGVNKVETLRLATNTLVWAEDGVTYRVEADITLAEALRIARSLR